MEELKKELLTMRDASESELNEFLESAAFREDISNDEYFELAEMAWNFCRE